MRYKTESFKCSHVRAALSLRASLYINNIGFSNIPRRRTIPIRSTIKQISIQFNGIFQFNHLEHDNSTEGTIFFQVLGH